MVCLLLDGELAGKRTFPHHWLLLCVCVCFVLEREESIAIDRVELYWHGDIEKYKTSTEMHMTIDGHHRWWYRHCVASQRRFMAGCTGEKGRTVHVELAIVANRHLMVQQHWHGLGLQATQHIPSPLHVQIAPVDGPTIGGIL